MKKLTAEQAFKAKYPKATIERHRRGAVDMAKGYSGVYYTVHRDSEINWVGCGDTPAQAWRDACDREGIDYRGRK